MTFDKAFEEVCNTSNGEDLTVCNVQNKLLKSEFQGSLYKYVTINNYNMANILNGEIYLNSANNMNDYFENEIHLPDSFQELGKINLKEEENPTLGRLFSDFIKQRDNGFEAGNEYLVTSSEEKKKEVQERFMFQILMNDPNISIVEKERIFQIAMDNFRKNLVPSSMVNISCFSEKFNNSAMWGHYADNFQGMVLEYDKEDLYKLVKSNVFISPVTYSEEKPCGLNLINYANLDAYFELTNQQFKYSLKNLICLEKLRINLRKSADWSYEGEWRIISENEQILSGIYPKKIILGPKTSEVDETLLRRIVEKEPKLSEVKILKTRKSISGYYDLELTE